MEKKNTMLLTVIAVATLLVAVVGATFAYFSLTVGGSTSATTVKATTGKIGVLTASGGEQSLTLKLDATQMSQAAVTGNENQPIHYFATTNGGTPEIVESESIGLTGPTGSNIYSTIGKLTLSGADEGTQYHCQGQYTISADVKKADGSALDSDAGDKTSITTGDGKLYLKVVKTDGVTVSIKEDEEDSPKVADGVENIDHELNSLISESKKFWVVYDFNTTSSSSIEGSIQAAFEIINRDAAQNYLANKQITITLTPSNSESTKLKCEIVEPD